MEEGKGGNVNGSGNMGDHGERRVNIGEMSRLWIEEEMEREMVIEEGEIEQCVKYHPLSPF